MVDYSKWKNIEISDDEDDTHPNIDTPSLFRWRHQARIERMAEMEKEKQEFEAEKERKLRELEEVAKRAAEDEVMKEKLKQLELESKKLKKKEEELKKKEKLTPWNVDTISKEGWSKTLINKQTKRNDNSNLTDEERNNLYREFVEKNEDKIKKYGMISKWDDCKRYLQEHPELVCEETANYLAIWCLNLAVQDKIDLMDFVAKQVISMQYILELSKQLDMDPRGCVNPFFNRIQNADKQYLDAFNDELESFKKRIRTRAQEKIEETMKEIEEEERQKRLGPGGLDPVEVFESLPECLQKCFESKDIQLLKDTLIQMDDEEARYYMKRCVDSGMWVPDASVSQAFESSDSGYGKSEQQSKQIEQSGQSGQSGQNEPTYDVPNVDTSSD